MRGRDPHAPPVPTIGQLGSGSVEWFWLWCAGRDCQHHAPLRLAYAIARWGADASSNVIRRKAAKSATDGHPDRPEWRSVDAVTGAWPFSRFAPTGNVGYAVLARH